MTEPKRPKLRFIIGAKLMAALGLAIAASVSIIGWVSWQTASDAFLDRGLAHLDAAAAMSARSFVAIANRETRADGGRRDPSTKQERACSAAEQGLTELAAQIDLGDTGSLLFYQRRGNTVRRVTLRAAPNWPKFDHNEIGLQRLVSGAQRGGRVVLSDPALALAYRHIDTCEGVIVVAMTTRELMAPAHAMQVKVALIGILLAIFGVGLAYLASRNLARRFRRLHHGVDRIARGDLDHRIALGSRDELGQLGAAIDDLAGRLAVDISDRRRSEQSLVESEEQYRTLFEESRDAILITEPSGTIRDANEATLDLLGYPRKQLFALHARAMFSNSADWQRFQQEIAKRGSLRNYEAKFRTKDGSVIDCLLSATAQYDHGAIVSHQSIIRDITKQKLSEKLLAEYSQNLERRVAERTKELSHTLDNLKEAQAQLVEAEKMAALGTLVAGVAHEISTPIGIGVTAASTLAEKTREISETYDSGEMRRSTFIKYLRAAEKSSTILLGNLERAAELISSFKLVAVDRSSEERRAFAIRGYLQEILLALHPKLKRTKHSIEIRCDDSLMIESYPGAFSQIVTNLVMNSLIHAYALDDEGHIVFDIHRVPNDHGPDRVVLEYSDDGVGIPAAHLGHVFEPFFSTRRGQGGSGLGLHIVYNLVTQRMGGTIRCDSEIGTGTKFIIEMPITS